MLRRSPSALWDALLLQPRRWEDEIIRDIGFGARMLPVIAGAAGSLLLARALRGFPAAEVSPPDPLAFGAMMAMLLIALVAAVYLPARSSTRVDPLVMLRHE